MNKYENVNLDHDSTVPLEHTFGRARVRVNDIHTMNKFIEVVGLIINDSYKKKINDIEKINGRYSSFGVTVENKVGNGLILLSSPRLISFEFLNLINILIKMQKIINIIIYIHLLMEAK